MIETIPPINDNAPQPKSSAPATWSLALIAFIVVAIAIMMIPNFVKSRKPSQMNACINNLRLIDGAKQQWALENGKKGDAVPTFQDLKRYIGRGDGVLPNCPDGGTYTIGAVSNAPTCSIPGHSIQ